MPSLCLKIEELYVYHLSDLEKSVIKPVLSKFALYKKRKLGKHTVDYDAIVDMASREKNLLEIYIIEVPEDEKPASHYKHFKDLSRKQ